MRLFAQFILRFLRRERLRSAVTVLGIAVGVAVVVAIRLANASSLRGFEAALDSMSGKTSLEVLGSGLGLNERDVAELGWLREFGVVSPVIEADAVARPLTDGEAAPARGELVRVLGIDILRDRPLRDYQIVTEGSATDAGAPSAMDLLDRLLDPDTVILTARYARRHGLREGSTVRVVTGDRQRDLTVRGLLGDEGPAKALDGNFAVMDIAAAQWAFDRLGYVDRLDVRLHDPGDIETAERAIAARLPPGLSVQRPARRGEQVERMLAAFHLNLTALSYIALVVGLFLVYNTVATSVIVRREEIGTLRALGVERGQVLRLFLGEAAILSLAGSGVGILLGRLLADAAVRLTSTTVNVLYVTGVAAPPALTSTDVLVALGVGIPLSLAAAALPALEAARVSPLAAIRGADRVSTRTSVRAWRVVAPLAFVASGWWLATLPPVAGMPLAGFAAAFSFVLAAAFTVPLVLFALGRVGRRPLARVFGVTGQLANANLAGSISRVAISVAALAVSLSMMVAIAVMIGSFRETVMYWVGQTIRADLFVGPGRTHGPGHPTVSEAVERVVRAHPAVGAVDGFRSVPLAYGATQATLMSTDFEAVAARGTLLFKEPADGPARALAAAGRDEVLVSEPFANRHGKRVGDVVEIPTPEGPRSFRIVAIYFDYSNERGIVAMDERTFSRHFGPARPTGVSVYLAEGADADRVREEMMAALPPDSRVFIYTNASLRGEVLRIFDATFAITYALEVIAILVAILGIAGTLLTLVLERRQEIAMLRLVGAERRQVRRIVMLEASLLGAVSQGVGVAVGLLLAVVLVYVINLQSFGWTLQFRVPWGFLGQMSFAIVVATALAGLYPARLASRMVLASQMSEE